jgi:xeroderma pigmentosum group C-complementing protein
MFKPSMVPDGCVHLQVSGLQHIAKRLNIECVPAVTGFEFHCRGSHAVIEGIEDCLVLKEDDSKNF